MDEDNRKSYAIERYFAQINEHLKTCKKCRENILECMSGTKE